MVIRTREMVTVLGVLFALTSRAENVILCGYFDDWSRMTRVDGVRSVMPFRVQSAVTDSNRVRRILALVDAGMFEWNSGDFIPMSYQVIDLLIYDSSDRRIRMGYMVTGAHMSGYTAEEILGRNVERNLKLDGDSRMADIVDEVMKEYEVERTWSTMSLPDDIDLSSATNTTPKNRERRIVKKFLLKQIGTWRSRNSGGVASGIPEETKKEKEKSDSVPAGVPVAPPVPSAQALQPQVPK